MRIRSLIIAASMAMAATTLAAQNVTYDYDKTVDFKSFRTFAWVTGTPLTDRLNHTRVVAAVTAQLGKRGLTEVASTSSPDILVAYHASFDRDLKITGFSSGWGPYRFGAGASGMARSEQILVGTLAVDIVNARTGTIVWRGVAVKDVNVNAKPEERDKNITRTAEKLFKSFPPAAR
jgi:hypothetical protein